MGYISFEQYKALGGKSDEASFSLLLIDAVSKLNMLTSCKFDNFLSSQLEVPQDIQRLLVITIDILRNQELSNVKPNLTSYSNGIESFSFGSSDVSKFIDKEIMRACKNYLAKYPEILYRGIR